MIKELRNKKKKGFSLVELVVVIAIIAILAAVAVPKYSAYKNNAAIKANTANAKLIAEATIMAIDSGEITAEELKSDIEIIKGAENSKWDDDIAPYLGADVESKTSDTTVKVGISNDEKKITATVGAQSYSIDY
ncbi:prepilin-type N-terminal cleavage/methylation domain-containing protein [Oceanirhabdus sp. W0125-5]|uniref:prepilin-type N-terminal cleavage/methylation domain-containing protein n=1 Tax=Oceanirhabdus sp. W0125-5 TaxID=2999116 RepID=UPI0022F34178|nr:prepilin-type N-terminal cleavage/methylation domain-containing protein [Oceanirhabdus sp. W0125-5]WBW99584.1 prepilin-type N-terminal cleavage/methylation domain-containing protein [Oceanirhabdus sp. W0125-5]